MLGSVEHVNIPHFARKKIVTDNLIEDFKKQGKQELKQHVEELLTPDSVTMTQLVLEVSETLQSSLKMRAEEARWLVTGVMSDY